MKSAINNDNMAKITPAKPFILMLYGFPGAGKTYFARQLAEKMQVAHLQADRIRAELFETPRYDKQENEVIMQLMNYMAGEFLSAGLSVIYDVNLMRASQRRALRDIARKAGVQPLLVWFQIDTDSAFSRGQKRDRRRIDDKYAASLDRASFDSIASNMQNPTNSEDYAVVSGKHVFTTQYAAVSRKLRDLGLLGIDDTGTNLPKPNLVNLVPNPKAGRVDMTRRNIIIR
jgi:predicted kinase